VESEKDALLKVKEAMRKILKTGLAATKEKGK